MPGRRANSNLQLASIAIDDRDNDVSASTIRLYGSLTINTERQYCLPDTAVSQ